MRFGIVLRVAGEASRPEAFGRCAELAEAAGLDELWVADHIAIPPGDTEGSGGRYLDPLASLAYLASATRRIGLGTGVLVLPYRPPLPTAKALATIQELSGGRLSVGVGIGWMKAEFAALGIDRRRRGRIADETLEVIRRCFDAGGDDVVTLNGQDFVFRPHPPRPRIFVGGAAPHALARAARHGDGWMPLAKDPDELAPKIAELRDRFAEAGGPEPEVVVMGQLGRGELSAERDRVRRLEEVGVTRLVQGGRYATTDDFQRLIDAALAVREAP